MTHEDYMKQALQLADQARSHGDVPVGCLIVYQGQVIGRGENRREIDHDPVAHAEILAIQQAAQHLQSWNLSDCTLYVTLEPCAMCSGAIVNARIDQVVFGAFDGEAGCCGSLYNLPQDKRLNHNAQVIGGVLNEQCATQLRQFFTMLRQQKKCDTIY